MIGFVTCVGYQDYLEKTLPTWVDALDMIVVITTPEEAPELDYLSDRYGNVVVHGSFQFNAGGAVFNKAAALSEAIRSHVKRGAEEWVLLFDSDVAMTGGLMIGGLPFGTTLVPGTIYGAHRRDEQGVLIPEPEMGGYFHLFHSSDPRWLADPTLGSWHNASGYDSAFLARWPEELRRYLPLTLAHYGPTGENWCGREGGKAAVEALQARRQAQGQGSWMKERLDR